MKNSMENSNFLDIAKEISGKRMSEILENLTSWAFVQSIEDICLELTSAISVVTESGRHGVETVEKIKPFISNEKLCILKVFCLLHSENLKTAAETFDGMISKKPTTEKAKGYAEKMDEIVEEYRQRTETIIDRRLLTALEAIHPEKTSKNEPDHSEDADKIKARERLESISESVTDLKLRYDMKFSEFNALRSMAREDIFLALATAYNVGYVRGHRATVAGAYTERKAGKSKTVSEEDGEA